MVNGYTGQCRYHPKEHRPLDASEHVSFANDKVATSFIEEIDFDYCAVDATAVPAAPGNPSSHPH
jgi:hypothetical protein